jgi:hypothetical protein
MQASMETRVHEDDWKVVQTGSAAAPALKYWLTGAGEYDVTT